MVTVESSKPVLPDFTRWQWAGLTERAWFAGLFHEASNAFEVMERYSVLAGIRKAAWQFIPLDKVQEMTEWAHRFGLMMVPTNGASTGGSYSTTPTGGPLNSLRVVFCRPSDYTAVLPWKGDDKIGDFLGFPPCCRQAFARTWGSGQVDSTWEQVAASSGGDASTLFRWMGIRLVPHMPCRFNCPESVKLAKEFYNLGLKMGFRDEVEFITEVLGWPTHASRRFGIAELASPALKIVTRTDWTPDLQSFFRPGTYTEPHEHWWTDNGFQHPDLMRRSHRQLLSVLAAIPPDARVMDLGCGNGLLMRRLKRLRPTIAIGGVDSNAMAIARAQAWMTGKWLASTIEDGEWQLFNPTHVLINPVRLTEMTPEDRDVTKKMLAKVPNVILYAYKDHLNTPLESAGLGPVEPLLKSPDVIAGLVRSK